MDIELKVSESLSGYGVQWPASRCGFVLCRQPAFPDASRRGWGGTTPKLPI